MSTERISISASQGWIELATVEDTTVAIENTGIVPVMIHFAPSLPAATALGHMLSPGSLLPRLAGGLIYARINRSESTSATLIVSK